MNTLLPVTAEDIKNVLFSRYQYTANAPVLSDIDSSGPREKAHII